MRNAPPAEAEGVYMSSLRSVFLACALWAALGLPGSAQWMFEKKPAAKGSSFEVAEKIPGDAQVTVGFALKGQLDVLGMASDFKAAGRTIDEDDIPSLEKELGQSIEQWLSLFSGRGYAAMLQPEPGSDWVQSFVLVLELDHPEAFRQWLTPRLNPAKEREIHGFRIREIRDGTQFGVGGKWFFITGDVHTTNRVAAALSGKAPVLANQPLFIKAQNALTGGASGVFAYLDGDKFRTTVYQGLEVSLEDPGVREFGFWDFAVASIDVKKEQGDAFIGFNKDAGPLLTALRKPGRVNGALLDLLPGNQSSLFALDAGWIGNTIDTLTDEIPALAMVVGMAYTSLNEYGDFGEAFQGTVAMGSNLPDVIGESLRQELYVQPEQADLAACKSNLKNLATGLEMWSSDNSGDYPDSLDKLTPNYLKTLPICPTRGAKPYTYEMVKVEYLDTPVYMLTCPGHQHADQGVAADYPRYSGSEGLIEGQEEEVPDPNRPAKNPEMEEPSMIVVVPVKSVAETHTLMVNALEANRSKPAEECGSNLKNIGTACEMYSTDHEGAYPQKLSDLIEGYYLYEVPTCPAAGTDTYSETYTLTRGADDKVNGFTVYCKGHNHPELETDRPFYDASEGLTMGPVNELPQPVLSQPGKGEKQTYTVEHGPKAVLDAGADLLRLGYGPKAEALLQEPGASWSGHPKIAEALSWAGNQAVYLDYLDLEPMYAQMKAALRQAAEAGEDEARFLQVLTDRMRPRVGALQGVSCVKVSDAGIHYRSQGVASTGQFLAGAIFGTMVYIPSNMAGARAQGQLTACKSNLKNIGTALEMWSTDNGGKYPDSMDVLTPDYLRVIPACPAADTDTYSATYRKFTREGEDYEGYEVYCRGHHHASAGADEDYPRYNAYDGLVEYNYTESTESPLEEAIPTEATSEGQPDSEPTP